MNMYEQAKKWLKELADEMGGPNALARRLNSDSQKIRRALEKDTNPAASSFVGWLEATGVRLVFPGQEERDLRLTHIPMAGAELGAGSSFFDENSDADEAKYYAFREDFIKKLRAPLKELKLFRVIGSSMEPVILPGDSVLVHLKKITRPRDGEMLVVRLERELLIKKIFLAPGGKLILRSTNKEWSDLTVDLSEEGKCDFEIIGAPLWIGRRL